MDAVVIDCALAGYVGLACTRPSRGGYELASRRATG
jgi:hypothetical protein